jgi:hypothetical protein
MCGACGLAPDRHWSAPFLATVPARSSAARAVTAMAARAGARVTVGAAAGGYALATATGRRSLAMNLGEVWDQLRQLRVVDYAVPSVPVAQLPSAGPATLPPLNTPVQAGARACPTWEMQLICTATPTWRYRFPAILAWLAAIDGRGPRRLSLLLTLTAQVDAAVDVLDGSVVRCAAVCPTSPTGSRVDLDDPSGSFSESLGVLLGPLTSIDA